MPRTRRALAAAAAVALLAVPAIAHAGAPQMADGPGGPSLLVTFRAVPTQDAARAALEGLGRVEPAAPEAGIWAVRAPADAGLREKALARPGVETAAWSLSRRTDERIVKAQAPVASVPVALTPIAAAPIDEYFANGRQWALTTPATTWGVDLTGTPPRPRIAILDSGVDSAHPEWSGPNSPLVRPYSAQTGRQSAEDWGKTGHGTHVAGSAAAPINGIGVVGTAPGTRGTAEVIPVQISDQDGYSTDETMIKGIRWSVQNGAKVINISAGGVGDSPAFQRVIDWAFGRGALVIASVGNDGQDYGALNYPAGYWNVLGVAAQCSGVVNADCPTPYGLARFSTRNRSVDLVAPGVDIISSVPPRVKQGEVSPGYAIKEGTSMATPFVAGVAAEVFAAHPGATAYQVLMQLLNTATDMGSPGRDTATGSGLINPRAAVTLPLPADDPYEPNSDISQVRRAKALTPVATAAGFADGWNDTVDVYPVTLRKGQSVRLSAGAKRAKLKLSLWPPGTRTVNSGVPAASNRRSSATPKLGYVATRSGRWYVSVKATAGRSPYRLTIGR
jgi:subtilisin family serine protease